MTMGAEIGVCGHKSKNVDNHQKLEETKDRFSREFPEGAQPCWFGTSSLQTEGVKVSCLKSPNVWDLGTAAPGTYYMVLFLLLNTDFLPFHFVINVKLL